jgi:hypothetical protein
MAILEVQVPQLSESVAEATLLQWHKKVGEAEAYIVAPHLYCSYECYGHDVGF